MKHRIALVALSAVALTMGCRAQVAGNKAAAPTNQTNAAAPTPQNTAAAAPTAPTGAPIDRAALVGRWGLEGDCANALDFRDDGTVMPGNGTWTLAGDQLTVTNEGRPPEVQTVARNADNGLTISGGGATMSMTRCE